MWRPSMKILIVARPAMVPQLQPAQIAIIAVGVAPTAKNMLQILTTAKHVTEMILTEREIRAEIAAFVTMKRPLLHGNMGIITLCLILTTVSIAMEQTSPEQIVLYPVSHATAQLAPLTVLIATPVLPALIPIRPMATPHTEPIVQARGMHRETAPTAMIYLLALPMTSCCLPLLIQLVKVKTFAFVVIRILATPFRRLCRTNTVTAIEPAATARSQPLTISLRHSHLLRLPDPIDFRISQLLLPTHGDTRLIPTHVLPAITLIAQKETLMPMATGAGPSHFQAVTPIPLPGDCGEMSLKRG
jgi:hypothetical protein